MHLVFLFGDKNKSKGGLMKNYYLLKIYMNFISANTSVLLILVQKSGYPLVVQVRGSLCFDDDSNEKAGLLSVHLQSCHTNLNDNGSFISDENMEKSLSTFKNRPILAYIHEVDGQPEFYGHNMHEDENGDVVYDEFPIGIIPESCNAKIVYDEEKGKIMSKLMAIYSKNIRKQQKSCRESKNVLYLLSFLLMN